MIFYYNQLKAEEERQIYLVLKKAVESYNSSIIIHSALSGAKILQIFTYLLLDYPDFFWTKGDFTLEERMTDEGVERRIRLSYLCNEIESRNRGNQIQEAIAEICGAIEDETTPENIVRSVSAWFQKNVSYFVTSGADQSIYSALVMKKSVCMGISKAITLVLRLYGIDSIVVMGVLFQEGIHAWNMIRLDAAWYHLDVAVGYECFDKVWTAHGTPNRKPLILVRKENLEETHSLREGIVYPQ